MKISKTQARRIALKTQLLDGRNRLPKGKEGIARAIEQLGYIQIDTISVIERAHHHTLWTRRPDYHPRHLDQLLSRDRRVFEYWGHAASYLPMSDYRFYLPKMKSFHNPKQAWYKNWKNKYGHLVGETIERIRNEGPLASKDFALPEHAGRGTWWDWKPYKVALELLFWRGDLMIAERRNFSRIYDLTERVLPDGTDTRSPDDDELGRFFVRRALNCFGLALEKEIHDYIHAADKKVLSAALREMVASGEVTRVQIDGESGQKNYALTDRIESLTKLRQALPRMFLLSPFDNHVIQRRRLGRLFDFDYSLECYTPAAKRRHGYFVLPILWGENIIGRLDPKADRQSATLIVRHVGLEDGADPTDGFIPALAEKLWDLARFNNCEKVSIEKTTPAGVKKELMRAIRLTASDPAP